MKTNVALDVSRRRLTAAALLSLASFAASINLVFAALVRMGDEFGVRPELLASITSLYFVAFFIVSSASGFVSDRWGIRAPLLFGNLMTMLGGLIFASAHGAVPLVLGAIVMGMGGGATEGMCTALLARIFPGRERFVVGVSQAGYCFGAIIGPLVMGILLPLGVSWRLFFIPVAALALANFVLFATSRYPPNEHAQPSRRPYIQCTGHCQPAARTRRAAVVRHHLPLRAGRNRFGQLCEPLSVRVPRCARASCHPGDRLVLDHHARWAAAVQHLAPNTGRPQADRRRHAQRRNRHPADHPLAGLAGRVGCNPGGLVPDGRNLAHHRGHDRARTPAGRVLWWGSRWRQDR